jgi:hypothetical protein
LAYFISENSAIEQYAIFIDLDDDFSKSGKPIFLEWCEANHERVICFLVSRKNEDFNSAKAYTQASSTESSLNILKSDLSVGYRFSGQEVSGNYLIMKFKHLINSIKMLLTKRSSQPSIK